jgi:valyl-tRNA synthetase
MTECLGRYQFDAATRAIRDFTWNEFCDWYLEMLKPRLRSHADVVPSQADGGAVGWGGQRAVAQRVLLAVLDSLVRLLQPFTPFLCEELWQRLSEIAPARAVPVSETSARLRPVPAAEACIIAPWPTIPPAWQDTALEKRFARLQETIVAVRNVRAIYQIAPATPVRLLMRATPDVAGEMQSIAGQFDHLAKAVLEAAGAEVERPTGSASFSLGDADGFIPLAGLINTEAELDRHRKEADRLRKLIASSEAKLSNEGFLSKAPEHVVAQHRETLETMQRQLATIDAIIADLS